MPPGAAAAPASGGGPDGSAGSAIVAASARLQLRPAAAVLAPPAPFFGVAGAARGSVRLYTSILPSVAAVAMKGSSRVPTVTAVTRAPAACAVCAESTTSPVFAASRCSEPRASAAITRRGAFFSVMSVETASACTGAGSVAEKSGASCSSLRCESRRRSASRNAWSAASVSPTASASFASSAPFPGFGARAVSFATSASSEVMRDACARSSSVTSGSAFAADRRARRSIALCVALICRTATIHIHTELQAQYQLF